MKKLSIDEALQLYEIIGDYIPEDASDEVDFIGTIVHNIRNGSRPQDYVKALSLLTGYTSEEITTGIDPHVSVELFYEGLLINQAKSLKKFCDKVTNG
jgi:hypothetical protein